MHGGEVVKIKSQYYINYDEDDISIMERLTDGGARFVSPISATAAMAWDGIERGLGREALIDAVANEFSVDPALVAADLDALLTRLLTLGYAEE